MRGAPYIACAVGLTLLMEYFGWFAIVDTRQVDAFLAASSVRGVDPTSGQPFSHVSIVGIDNDDYDSPRLFRGESPLKPVLVAQLIANVQAQRPRVVGVDIDTASRLYAANPSPLRAQPDWAPIVWASAGTFNEDACLTGRHPVLGGKTALLRPADAAAIDDLPLDDDGYTRHYVRAFAAASSRCSEHAPPAPQTRSFVSAIAEAFCSAPGASACDSYRGVRQDGSRELMIDFRGECFASSSSECIRRAMPRNPNEITEIHSYIPARVVLDAPRSIDLGMRDRIVLIGGFFDAGRDVKATSFGPRQGIELLARSIETELGGGGVRDAPVPVAVFLDVALGVLLIYVGYRFTFSVGLAVTLALLPVVVVLSSVLAFLKFGHWVSVAPIFCGMLLHNAVESGIESARHRREEENERRKAREGAPAVEPPPEPGPVSVS